MVNDQLESCRQAAFTILMLSRRLLLGIAVGALAVASSGCKKSEPADKQKSEESAPASSSVAAPASAAPLAVRDAGLTGAVDGGAPVEVATVKLIDPGAEPRAPRKYTFVANRVDKRVLSVTQSATQMAEGIPPQEIMKPMETKYHLDLKAKDVTPKGATFEMKVTKAEPPPGAPAQVTTLVAGLKGMTATLEVLAHGEVGELILIPGSVPEAQQQLAQQIMDTLRQGIQLLVAPLPEAPIGRGAKWEIPIIRGEGVQGVKQYTLKELTPEGGSIDVTAQIKIPRRKEKAPEGGGSVYIQVEGHGKHSQEVRFNQLSPKAESDFSTTEKVEMPDESGVQQTLSQLSTMKQTLTTPAP